MESLGLREKVTMSLVYDVGMFNGDDTAYLLGERIPRRRRRGQPALDPWVNRALQQRD
jgi:hypothetical protein